MTQDLATVLIVVQGDARIYRLLNSLLNDSAGNEASIPFEIIVVENGSAKLQDVESVGNGKVRYIHLEAANMAAARNAGLRAARGTYLLLTAAGS